jgi:CspA family cold shock protein
MMSQRRLKMVKGTVKWYDKDKGYGFIEAEDGYDIYVHTSSIKGSGLKNLYKGDKVTFDVGSGKKGPVAIDVQVTGDRNSKRRRMKQYKMNTAYDE